MDVMFSSVQHFCALYLVQCSLGLLAPESVGTCGSELPIWTQLVLHLLLGLFLLPLARAALTHRAPPPLAPPRRHAVLQRRPPRPTRSRPDLFGMERYEARLIDFLERERDDDDSSSSSSSTVSTSMLAITGARGVGKSTLLRLARTYYYQQRFFGYILYADAGQDGFTADALRGELARGVGWFRPPAAASTDHIATFLRSQSFLLLLDDVQAGGLGFDLADAGLPTTTTPLGPRQKVVFATRHESVCAAMGCADDEGNVIRMGCLGDDDAWNLFQYCVGGNIIDSNPMIKAIAKEMVGKCGGYPGALVRVGLSMSIHNQLESWIYADEVLSKNPPPGPGAIHQDNDDQGYPCLQSFMEEFGC
ncbi:putative disease resistance protein At3g15700 [Sorghum bicolor]|uniref:NB-ARC domain-containing protein n=1 Tax=Sorghum bicolor TaxID=4558 RepID=C5XIN0_SORBI|nr:putative disease resistance protein At3g15700 [Sorghum bicolor]EES04264.1 hypothetical protein SORBI_3003G435900 [Sorghum bicolor]|eukprot:XP_002459144.1 putative disease resistance protein At3g15700 [Sorghum bicolor]